MVYARALRALECITHAGPSPALGTLFVNDKKFISSHKRFYQLI